MTSGPAHLPELRAALLAFYDAERRDLPWRRTRDPYAIWVSEIMLQQTQVDTVKPRYAAFLARFPSVRTLAAADETEVCEAWAGLGYYRRARHLHAAARRVVEAHQGELPRTARELHELPGIGRYTAGAIASIAHGEAAPLVDGNVARVFARIFEVEEPLSTTLGAKRLWALAEGMVSGARPGDFNQALMELGATVCTPKAPSCPACPARRWCRAFASGEPTRLPLAAKAATVKPLEVAFAWIERDGGVLLEQRPVDGLWAGLWELPSGEAPRPTGAASALREKLGGARLSCIAEVRHALSHRSVTARVFRARGVRYRHGRVFADPLSAPLSSLARKAIAAAKAAVTSSDSDGRSDT